MLECLANTSCLVAGLEGLMQAIACKRVIGWRDGVRRVILLITDQVKLFKTMNPDYNNLASKRQPVY